MSNGSQKAFTGDFSPATELVGLQLVDCTQGSQKTGGGPIFCFLELQTAPLEAISETTQYKEPGNDLLCLNCWRFQSQLLTPDGSKVMTKTLKGVFWGFSASKILKIFSCFLDNSTSIHSFSTIQRGKLVYNLWASITAAQIG